MTVDYQHSCSLILGVNQHAESEVNELRRQLEIGDEEVRIGAMKSTLQLLSLGQLRAANSLLMTIIRFVLPNQKNKLLKKLVLLFFELAPKTDGEGKLLSEMILLCNALRNDLQHPNEYVRGVTLRFLTRIRESEILEPLIPSEHRHPYVRRNAIFALYGIYQTNDFLVPDTPEETDAACLRNAFMVLSHTDPELAWEYYSSLGESISSLDPALQLVIIDFIRADSTKCPDHVPKNVKSIILLLQSMSTVVKFEAATALMLLSNSVMAIKTVASTYIDLAVRETDNNAKLMILDRYAKLQETYASLINEEMLDVLRVLTASDLAVRQKALDLLSAGVTARHASDLVAYLIKSLGKLGDYDRSAEYKQSLLAAIDSCANQYPTVAPIALKCFVDLLTTGDGEIIFDAIRFSKEILERNAVLRKSALVKLLDAISEQCDARAVAGLLWIIGEVSEDGESIGMIIGKIRELVGPLPFKEEPILESPETEPTGKNVNKSPIMSRKINTDGTYATESAFTATNSYRHRDSSTPILRELLQGAEWGVAVALGSSLCKLSSRANVLNLTEANAFKAIAMLIITSTIKLGLSQMVKSKIDRDTYDRLLFFLKVLAKPTPQIEQAFYVECHRAFEIHLKLADSKRHTISMKSSMCQADDQIDFRFANSSKATTLVIINDYVEDLELALGSSSNSTQVSNLLSKVIQLTGFSDEIYAETYITISHSDIILDVLLANQTDKMMQNVSIELSTGGDLVVSEKPTSLILPPRGFALAKASLKVRSTDNGMIFGCISYGVTDIKSIVLATIQIDVSEYIKPTAITDQQFRTIWPTLEWENKIIVPNIPSSTLRQVMSALLHDARLFCITPDYGINDTDDYLAANVHGISTFGEEILANVCLENGKDGITGHLRLRSKTQGIAIALGDRITEIVTKLAANKDY